MKKLLVIISIFFALADMAQGQTISGTRLKWPTRADSAVVIVAPNGRPTLKPLAEVGSGGSATVTQQDHNAGATVTISNGTGTLWLAVNPASTLAALTITLPATPTDGQVVETSFGGTLTSGVVVTSLTISPNAAQAIIQATTPSNAEAGEIISYRWKSSVSKWYRIN